MMTARPCQMKTKRICERRKRRTEEKQLTFLGGEDLQAKGILLAPVTPEILHTLQTMLTNDGGKVLDKQNCKDVYDALKKHVLSVEEPMVLVRKQAFLGLRQAEGEPVADYLKKIDAIQAHLLLTGSGFTQQELFDKVYESLLPMYNNETRMNKKFVSEGGKAIYSWLSSQLISFELSEALRSTSVEPDAQVAVRAYATNVQPAVAPGQVDVRYRGRGSHKDVARGGQFRLDSSNGNTMNCLMDEPCPSARTATRLVTLRNGVRTGSKCSLRSNVRSTANRCLNSQWTCTRKPICRLCWRNRPCTGATNKYSSMHSWWRRTERSSSLNISCISNPQRQTMVRGLPTLVLLGI